ncbi:redoxin domain-containing protein [Pelagicoccus mobilis]|uniref:Redoxin domain-containing protein n=1 Tax=Pelagicoccus mobilis TaxID=415221 RepID=A0A934VN69_9BACT|nr:redoxin domain-containing protein [Pelagicoccus mobilis]MBK1875917.1 redoxin domain-containing protein [Pelagicoccus mobilis]
MQKRCYPFLLVVAACLLLASVNAREVPNFNLVDIHDRNHELYRAKGKAVVLFFTGTGCPIARKSSAALKELKAKYEPQGVDFWIVNSYFDEKKKDINKEINDLGLREFIYLRDLKQLVALSYGVNRTAEIIAIDTTSLEIFYQGAINDQFGEGAERPAPTENYLDESLSQFLAGEPIARPKTRARGCRISYAKVGGDTGVPDYVTQVAPLLRENCVECHRRGGIGPWSMTSHRRVSNYSDMIEEVILTRRMPPWDPHPDYGHFKDGQELSREELQTILQWVKAGAPKGDGEDPLRAPLPDYPDWRLGEPDVVLKLPEVQTIAATGVEPYRYIEVENPFDEDVWLSGLDVKPGNRSVVHHVILYAKWPGGPSFGDNGAFFIGWAPGASALQYSDGVAKKLPAHAKLTIEMHYTTNGTEETDQSEVALYLAKGPQERNAETRAAADWNLEIAPGDHDSRHVATYAFKKPATLYALFPHMHFRGKWMRYELLTPNGKRETLLHVPRYDFQWQLSYYLQEPLKVPAGSWLMVTGAFDNSPENPANPDPKKRVLFGQQSWDEMFIGFFEAADDPEPLSLTAK